MRIGKELEDVLSLWWHVIPPRETGTQKDRTSGSCRSTTDRVNSTSAPRHHHKHDGTRHSARPSSGTPLAITPLPATAHGFLEPPGVPLHHPLHLGRRLRVDFTALSATTFVGRADETTAGRHELLLVFAGARPARGAIDPASTRCVRAHVAAPFSEATTVISKSKTSPSDTKMVRRPEGGRKA